MLDDSEKRKFTSKTLWTCQKRLIEQDDILTNKLYHNGIRSALLDLTVSYLSKKECNLSR